jgi:hypothetical protein
MHAIKSANEMLNPARIAAVHAIAQSISDYALMATCQRAFEGKASYTDREEIYVAFTKLAKALAEVR